MEVKRNTVTLWRTSKEGWGQIHPGDLVVYENNVYMMINRTDKGTKLFSPVGVTHGKCIEIPTEQKELVALTHPKVYPLWPFVLAFISSVIAIHCLLVL